MRRFRTRRRKGGSWFPLLGIEPEEGYLNTGEGFSFICDNLIVAPHTGADPLPINVHGLTYDFPTEAQIIAADQIPSLADWQGSAWRLETILGKLFVNLEPGGAARRALVKACFFVAKVDDQGNPLSTDATQDYNPWVVSNVREPYIWMRSWVLERASSPEGLGVRNSGIPSTNVLYGSLEDGPHIHTRTKRFISKEERLFFAITAYEATADLDMCPVAVSENAPNADISYFLDIRLVGRLARMKNRGATL